MADDGNNECTSGWSVERMSDGLQGVATAAHCEGINQFRETSGLLYSAPFVLEHIGKYGDMEWHTTIHIEYAEFYASPSYIRDVDAIEPRDTILQGESVCHYGRKSNSRVCTADVEDTWASARFEWNGQWVTASQLVRMDRRAGMLRGDSGGPWFWNNRAYGLTQGWKGSDGDALWSRADNLPAALGVRVMTK